MQRSRRSSTHSVIACSIVKGFRSQFQPKLRFDKGSAKHPDRRVSRSSSQVAEYFEQPPGSAFAPAKVSVGLFAVGQPRFAELAGFGIHERNSLEAWMRFTLFYLVCVCPIRSFRAIWGTGSGLGGNCSHRKALPLCSPVYCWAPRLPLNAVENLRQQAWERPRALRAATVRAIYVAFSGALYFLGKAVSPTLARRSAFRRAVQGRLEHKCS